MEIWAWVPTVSVAALLVTFPAVLVITQRYWSPLSPVLVRMLSADEVTLVKGDPWVRLVQVEDPEGWRCHW